MVQVRMLSDEWLPRYRLLENFTAEWNGNGNAYDLRKFCEREEEKWTNKGTAKQYVADSLLHSTTCHYQALYQIS